MIYYKNMILDKPIIAIDFDGTLTIKDTRKWNNGESYNDNPKPRKSIINWLLKHRNKFYLILWSCREGKDLEKAIIFARQYGIIFDSINENLAPYPTSAKIMADYYLDDKSIKPADICSQFVKHLK